MVVAVVLAGAAIALLRGSSSEQARGAEPSASHSGPSSVSQSGPTSTPQSGPAASMPAQRVAPYGTALGVASPTPAAQHAGFLVPVSIPSEPNSPFLGDWTLDVYPADVKTFAGRGSGHADAPFGGMGGVVTVDGAAYVVTADAITAVDLQTGAITTFAGSPTEQGCVAAGDPSAVRFRGPAGDVATDGHELFVADGCGISKVSLSSGATTSLTSWSGPLTVGPDGYLYAGSFVQGQAAIVQVNPATGTMRHYVTFPSGSYVMGLAADGAFLWASVDEGPSSPAVIDQISFADGTITRYAAPGVDVVGTGQLVSAGLYLYAPAVGGHGVIQYTKHEGVWGEAVGGDAGDQDGVWAEGTFGDVRGIASDGRELWVTDVTNDQLRRVRFNALAGQQMGVG